MLLYISALATRFHYRDREEGQAMVEYALILALVSVAAIAALTLIGTNVTAIFDKIEKSLKLK